MSLFVDFVMAPVVVANRFVDAATGGRRINIDDTYYVPGNDPGRWADAFIRKPAAMAPMGMVASQRPGTMSGRPFPGGPKVALEVLSRTDGRTPGGHKQTVIEIAYGGDFNGRGRITITQAPGKGLAVRDQWFDVENNSWASSRACEVGHPAMVAVGFDTIARKA